ncbi:MAG: type II toxin-antitoxin system RelB/DinJ family antitoxin [Cocleimonas sp.]|nr:type II toxin-antitoxin system RelB/DinJ family antitoxin [Cocleimonas sp.]
MKTAIINARIKPDLKGDVEHILAQLGITTTQAITMFFEQIRMNGGIPFPLKIPNEETKQAMMDARENQTLEVTLDELKENLAK